MSFSADNSDHGSDEASSEYAPSYESSEGIAEALSKSFGFRCQPVLSVKAKSSCSSKKLFGKQLPALSASLSYTRGHLSNYSTAVIKPTEPRNKWVRKVKLFPESQEVRVVSQEWTTFDGALKLQGTLNWAVGSRIPTLTYMAKTRWDREPHTTSKISVPKAPSLMELRSHWNIKSVMPQVSGRIGGGEAENSVTHPRVDIGIPQVELVLNVGKPSNWRSIWPPTQWFSSKKAHAAKKAQWEQSLEHDSRKDLYIQSLSPEDRQAYHEAHPTDI